MDLVIVLPTVTLGRNFSSRNVNFCISRPASEYLRLKDLGPNGLGDGKWYPLSLLVQGTTWLKTIQPHFGAIMQYPRHYQNDIEGKDAELLRVFKRLTSVAEQLFPSSSFLRRKCLKVKKMHSNTKMDQISDARHTWYRGRAAWCLDCDSHMLTFLGVMWGLG